MGREVGEESEREFEREGKVREGGRGGFKRV
jgi:hypothetical protein